MFSCEFCEISKNTFSIEHLQATASAVYEKLLMESHLDIACIAGSKQHIRNPILKLLGVQGYISDCHLYQFKTILDLRM